MTVTFTVSCVARLARLALSAQLTMNAFVGTPAGVRIGYSSFTSTSTSTATTRRALALHSRQLRAPVSLPSYTRPRRTVTLCLAAEAKSEPEEEVLDEKAMRAAEIHEVLVGLEDFKMRIVEDATKLAKKVRAPKKQLEAALEAHPDILKIDGHIRELQEELKQLGDR